MGSKLTCCLGFMLVFIVCGMGGHVAGILTDYWLIGFSEQKTSSNTTSSNMTSDEDTAVLHVNMGLFRQVIELNNGTVIRSGMYGYGFTEQWHSHTNTCLELSNDKVIRPDSSLNIKEENYLFVAIAGVNTLLCLVLICKAVHICIGIVAFVTMSLMIIVTFYSFQHTTDKLEQIQEFESSWPVLKLSWSYILTFGGLLLNILSTAIFLTLLLIKGEIKASKSNKGLGPTHEHDQSVVHDKTPIISMVTSHDNDAYNHENMHNSNMGASGSGTGSDVTLGYATPIHDSIMPETVVEDDIALQESSGYDGLQSQPLEYVYADLDEKCDGDEPFSVMVELANECDEQNFNTVTESCRL